MKMEKKEALLNEFQQTQQVLQQYELQKKQFQLQIKEIDNALKELEISDVAYKLVGDVLIKRNKDDLMKELKEKKELIELRIKNYDKQIKQLESKMKELRDKIVDLSKKGN